MTQGVLHDVTLGYQLLWNASRQVSAVRLDIDACENSAFDNSHLLGALHALWNPQSPLLLLSTSSDTLLADLLDLTPPEFARLEVPDEALQHPAMASRVMRASQRGLKLVWRGQPGTRCKAAHAGYFSQNILALSTDEAVTCLRIALRSRQGDNARVGPASPVRPAQIYEGVASRVLANHCLDDQGADALLGWPVEDVLHFHRKSRIQPDHMAICRLIKAIDDDGSMDLVEQWLSEEPVLAYRFLRYTNSTGLGLNREIHAVRQGLMVLGLSRLKLWLLEQLPNAAHDVNLQPVRTTMVLRAQFMAELLDVGEGEALKRELYLCGLLSQIDALVTEPLPSALRAIPLPLRIKEALLTKSGPYWPYLDLASSLEASTPVVTRACCKQHAFNLEEVNVKLLHTLSGLKKSINLPIKHP